jgi:hypothetical protein
LTKVLYRNDAKSVAIVALGCFHPVTKVQSASLHFFVGNDEGSKDSDDESDDDVGSCLQKRYPIAQTIIITRCLSTCARISQQSVDIPVNPAKRSVYIPTLWNDHSSGLGLIVGLATSGARAALRRHPRSHICPQRPTSFRMAPRHLKHHTGVQVFLTLHPFSFRKTVTPHFRYSNLADWCSCATMADTTSRSCASKAVGYSTKTSKSAVNAARVYFFELGAYRHPSSSK